MNLLVISGFVKALSCVCVRNYEFFSHNDAHSLDWMLLSNHDYGCLCSSIGQSARRYGFKSCQRHYKGRLVLLERPVECHDQSTFLLS